MSNPGGLARCIQDVEIKYTPSTITFTKIDPRRIRFNSSYTRFFCFSQSIKTTSRCCCKRVRVKQFVWGNGRERLHALCISICFLFPFPATLWSLITVSDAGSPVLPTLPPRSAKVNRVRPESATLIDGRHLNDARRTDAPGRCPLSLIGCKCSFSRCFSAAERVVSIHCKRLVGVDNSAGPMVSHTRPRPATTCSLRF